MTTPPPPYPPDAAPPSAGDEANSSWNSIRAGVNRTDALVVVVAVVIGVILFVGQSLVLGSSYSSTALVNGGPGDSPSKPLNLSSDQLNRYVDTELIFISTLADEISANVTTDTGVQNPPPVAATQDGNTNVIQLTMIGDSPEQAAEMATSAANTYIANWKVRNGVEAVADVDKARVELAKTEAELAKLDCSGNDSVKCSELEALKVTYQAALVNSDRFVEKPTADLAKKTTSTIGLAVLGAIVGFAIGVLIVYLRVRSRSLAR